MKQVMWGGSCAISSSMSRQICRECGSFESMLGMKDEVLWNGWEECETKKNLTFLYLKVLTLSVIHYKLLTLHVCFFYSFSLLSKYIQVFELPLDLDALPVPNFTTTFIEDWKLHGLLHDIKLNAIECFDTQCRQLMDVP